MHYGTTKYFCALVLYDCAWDMDQDSAIKAIIIVLFNRFPIKGFNKLHAIKLTTWYWMFEAE